MPPSNDELAGEIWPAGSYRIELRIGKRIGIIDVGLPGRFERIQPMPLHAAARWLPHA